ncbi:MAG: DnaJ domain-containing protein [Pseudomonadota bacterium]
MGIWPFLIAIFLAAIGYFGLTQFVKADPAKLARFLKRLAGAVLIGLGIVLLLTGRLALLGLPVGLAGLYLFLGAGRLPRLSGGGRPRARGYRRTSGGARPHHSTVRSKLLEMTLNHESGQMDGVVLDGPFAGRPLSSLSKDELKQFFDFAQTRGESDAESLSLFEAYLDSTLPGWREDFHAHAANGQRATSGSGAITEEEAYEILGLLPGADEAAIRDAHRRLMLKLHPDRGGSTFLAAKINEAKDILLRNHSSAS